MNWFFSGGILGKLHMSLNSLNKMLRQTNKYEPKNSNIGQISGIGICKELYLVDCVKFWESQWVSDQQLNKHIKDPPLSFMFHCIQWRSIVKLKGWFFMEYNIEIECVIKLRYSYLNSHCLQGLFPRPVCSILFLCFISDPHKCN